MTPSLNILLPAEWFDAGRGWNVAAVEPLVSAFGEDLPDGAATVRTVLAHRDREGSDELRAASFPNISPQATKDGRWLIQGVFVVDQLLEAFNAGQISGVELISDKNVIEILSNIQENT